MQITKILPNNYNYVNPFISQKKVNNSVAGNYTVSSKNQNITAENIKAYFIPSFGRFMPFAYVSLTDRETGKEVPAVIKRNKTFKDDYDYKLFVDNKEAGYMNLKCESLLPEDDGIVAVSNNIFPEVHYLRTIEGEKYAGIGTSLIRAAIHESKRLGFNGAIWLATDRGYARELSNYRKDENPIPFYYKLGFTAVSPTEDKEIKYWLQRSQPNMLPDSSLLVLTEEAANADNKYFSRKFNPV